MSAHDIRRKTSNRNRLANQRDLALEDAARLVEDRWPAAAAQIRGLQKNFGAGADSDYKSALNLHTVDLSPVDVVSADRALTR